jgi:CDP-4-dehydro-6-deoxyglucose reductase/3-phenylpropionate/trans-cinnamate dioxygenase ferredoxin reductase subunit/phenol hydroxylase P5 protein
MTVLRATLVGIETVAKDTNVYRLALQEPLAFQAGQFINLSIPGAAPRGERSYSLYSEPLNAALLELCIKLLPGGAASEYLRLRAVGDILMLRGPFGHFTLPEADNPVVMVATATGLAPYRSMLLQAARQGDKRTFVLYFGVKAEEDLFAIDELKNLQKQLSLQVTFCLSRTQDASLQGRVFYGRVTAAVQAQVGDAPLSGAWMLCGNGAMIQEMRDFLKSYGLDRKKIHFEKYF